MSHTHSIVDADIHFVIDPLLRSITTTTELVLVQGDHNSKRYSFEIPRFIEGHDMSLCNRIEVHYDNISRNKKELSEGFYVVNDITVIDDALQFSWLISGNATRLAGTLQFWINFSCIDENNEIVYSWGTDNFKNIRILSNNRNTDIVIATFPDVLEQWKQEVFDEIGTSISDDDIVAAISAYLEKNPDVDFGGVDFEVDNDTLKLENGILSVNTTDQMEQDNTLPITSAGVYATVGNIEVLLKTI